MTELILSVAEITVTMAIVILILLAIFKIFGKRMRAKSRYIVLTIVLVRLAIPFELPGVPTLINVELTTESSTDVLVESTDTSSPNSHSQEINTIQKIGITNNISKEEVVYINEDHSEINTDAFKSDADGIPFYKRISRNDLLKFLFAVYVFGTVAFLVVSLFAHFLYIQRIKKGRTLGEERVYSIYANVCRRNGITNPPLLWESTVADSPMILGIIIPRIVIPAGLDEEALSGMLEHELKHYTRRDLWVKFICLVARSLHWFNPLVHIASVKCVQEMELSCDADVLADCDLEERRKYGNAMLDIVRRCSSRGISLTTHFSPRKKAVKERFAGIVDMQSKKRGVWLIIITVFLCILSGVLVSCSVNITSILHPLPNTDTTDEVITTSVAVAETTAETTNVETTEVITETVPTETSSVSLTEPVEETPKFVEEYIGDGFTVSEYATSDGTEVYWNILLDNGQRIKYTLEKGVSSRPDISEVVSLVDVNFDGLKDILICKGAYGVHKNVYYLCYLNTSGKYSLCNGFENIANPTINANEKFIYGTSNDGFDSSVANIYGIYNGEFILFDTAAANAQNSGSNIVFQTDFSNASVLDSFDAYQGEWAVRDGRLWLKEIYARNLTLGAACSLLIYNGDECKNLTDYTVDVDIYNVQTQSGVILRSNFESSKFIDADSFFGYYLFVSKNGQKSAIALGDTKGDWGCNLLVEDGVFRPGYDLHLHAIVSGSTIRCIFTDLHTGDVLSDIQCIERSWSQGTFGFRMLSEYNGLTSLNITSFDNLVVTRL